MNLLNILSIVWAFLVSVSIPLILTLIGVDLGLGIFCAIKKGLFEWGKVGKFYQTMIVPYVGGYLVLQIAFVLLPEQLGAIIPPVLAGAALAAILANLASSIMRHIKEIGIPIVPGEIVK